MQAHMQGHMQAHTHTHKRTHSLAVVYARARAPIHTRVACCASSNTAGVHKHIKHTHTTRARAFARTALALCTQLATQRFTCNSASTAIEFPDGNKNLLKIKVCVRAPPPRAPALSPGARAHPHAHLRPRAHTHHTCTLNTHTTYDLNN